MEGNDGRNFGSDCLESGGPSSLPLRPTPFGSLVSTTDRGVGPNKGGVVTLIKRVNKQMNIRQRSGSDIRGAPVPGQVDT